MNFQLPKQDEDFDYYANSSQDESRGIQGRQFGLLEILSFACVPFFECIEMGLGFILTLDECIQLINHIYVQRVL